MKMLPIPLCHGQENRSIFLHFLQQQFHSVLKGERVRGKGAGGEGGKVGLQQGEHVRQLPSAEPMNLHGLSQDALVVE